MKNILCKKYALIALGFSFLLQPIIHNASENNNASKQETLKDRIAQDIREHCVPLPNFSTEDLDALLAQTNHGSSEMSKLATQVRMGLELGCTITEMRNLVGSE